LDDPVANERDAFSKELIIQGMKLKDFSGL
jgi:hypothetical protein